MAVFSSPVLFEDTWLQRDGNACLADWCFDFLTSVSSLHHMCTMRTLLLTHDGHDCCCLTALMCRCPGQAFGMPVYRFHPNTYEQVEELPSLSLGETATAARAEAWQHLYRGC